jgi:actinin alpha
MNALRRHSDADAMPTKRKGKEALLLWCQTHTASYKNVSITNFSSSWKDGLGFCALLHRFAPSEIKFSELKPENTEHNLTLAFSKADDLFDIFQILDAEDMKEPDAKCVVTYLASE